MMLTNLLKLTVLLLVLGISIISCNSKNEKTAATETHTVIEESKPSVAALKERLMSKGYQIFDYVDPDSGDTVVMQQYYIAFLKRGPNRSQDSQEADSLQVLHMEHLGKGLLEMMEIYAGLQFTMSQPYKWQIV